MALAAEVNAFLCPGHVWEGGGGRGGCGGAGRVVLTRGEQRWVRKGRPPHHCSSSFSPPSLLPTSSLRPFFLLSPSTFSCSSSFPLIHVSLISLTLSLFHLLSHSTPSLLIPTSLTRLHLLPPSPSSSLFLSCNLHPSSLLPSFKLSSYFILPSLLSSLNLHLPSLLHPSFG